MYKERDEKELFEDLYAGPWIKDCAHAHAKMMLGEARSKFSAIQGPGGGTSLNGDALKTESQADMERLEEELRNFKDGSAPYGIIIG